MQCPALSRCALAAVLLVGVTPGSFANESDPASAQTIAANQALLAQYPFADKADFAAATRGLIEALPDNGVIRNSEGRIVWNLPAYTDFISVDKPAPDTVNPSLWRQSQLLMINGLFEVVPGVYQVRSADLANMTIVEGERGITIYDPLLSAEASRAALDLYYKHRDKRPVVAVLFTHSHADHFGGVFGVTSQADIDAGKVQVIAPAHFIEASMSENVFAGTAMARRASFMFGNVLPKGAKGQVGAGLGISTTSGSVSIAQPTDTIEATGEVRTIDGIKYEFLLAPDSEAPSEMMWYLPDLKLINTAEEATHTMHNLYTLRGAKTRDARLWPQYLNEVLKRWGDKYEAKLAMHHWPTWGNAEINKHIKAQRDIYKYLHDRTLHFANQGYTMNELPDLVKLPQALVDNWSAHGYYGTKSHNVRAVYNYYLGYFDGNPAHLNPLAPVEVGKRYVAAMGGADQVLAQGKTALEAGDYRWGAELVNHLVFADPDNQAAKNLLASHYEQLGYQAESGPWRNFYLGGAGELRNGIHQAATPKGAGAGLLKHMSLDLIFGYMGVRLKADAVTGLKITQNWVFPDVGAKYALFLENSVLNHWPDYSAKDADVTVTLDRAVFDLIIGGEMTMPEAIKAGKVVLDGNPKAFMTLMKNLEDLRSHFWFNLVTP